MSDNPFVGTWRLLSFEVRSNEGKVYYPWGEHPIGYIMYNDDGYMSVSMMDPSRPRFDVSDLPRGTVEQKAAAADKYISYAGKYETKGNKVYHHVDVSLFPDWVGGDQVRNFKFEDNRLMLSTDRETGKVKKKMSLARFQKVVDINLTGVFLTVRECTEQMVNHRCRGLICLVSSTGSLGTAGQINYSSTKAAMSVMPKVLTAEFFRRGLSHRIRCVAVAPGYCATPILEGMNQKALDSILSNVPIGRLIRPDEIASLVCELYRNEALAGDVFYVHGGLRLGSKG